MSKSTRIYDKFEYWSAQDCACSFCRYFAGEKRGCRLAECRYADIKQEAARREAVRERRTGHAALER
jgi:hypothetical protein